MCSASIRTLTTIPAGTALRDVRETIIRPALASVGLAGDAAVNLVTGIGLVESRYRYLRQIGGGPALGYWQMEPFTHDDCWKNFLAFRPMLSRLVLRASGETSPTSADLITNIRYAAIMARVKCFRSSRSLPSPNDATGLCTFWKTVYNTSGGAGEIDAAHIALFQRGIDACGHT